MTQKIKKTLATGTHFCLFIFGKCKTPGFYDTPCTEGDGAKNDNAFLHQSELIVPWYHSGRDDFHKSDRGRIQRPGSHNILYHL